MILSAGQLALDDGAAHFEKATPEIDIGPLQSNQFALAQPGPYGTKENGIEGGDFLASMLEESLHFLCVEWRHMKASVLPGMGESPCSRYWITRHDALVHGVMVGLL